MTGRRNDWNLAHAALLRHIVAQLAQNRPRGHDFRQKMRRQSEIFKHGDSPATAARIVHLAGRGDGVLRLFHAREQVVEQVRHEQQRVGHLQQPGLMTVMGNELKQRVELHELDARGIEDVFAANAGEGLLHHAVGASIAVMVGKPKQLALLIQQPVIDAPGIDADAVNGFAGRCCGSQSGFEVLPLRQQIPVQMTIHPSHRIGKAVFFFKGQPAIRQLADQRSPAFSSHVKCHKPPLCHRLTSHSEC